MDRDAEQNNLIQHSHCHHLPRAERGFAHEAQVNRELPMDMEREDSNPSIEALIEAHEDAIADNAVTTDGENDETPRPSAIVPKHASHAPHPDLTVAIGSSDAFISY